MKAVPRSAPAVLPTPPTTAATMKLIALVSEKKSGLMYPICSASTTPATAAIAAEAAKAEALARAGLSPIATAAVRWFLTASQRRPGPPCAARSTTMKTAVAVRMARLVISSSVRR